MPEFSILQLTPTYVIAIAIFALVMLSYWAGHRSRMRAIANDPEHAKADLKTINGMLVGLLGLLLAFTFSMSNSRYDDRRHLIVVEANIIGTTILRTDMYPDSIRTLLRSALKGYVDKRIAFYQAGMDLEKAMSEFRAGQALSAEVWRIATEYAKTNENTTRTAQLIPSINEMIDITSTRLAAGEGTIPDSIMCFLYVLCVCTSFMLGYDQSTKVDWIMVTGFAVALSATVFSIVDLDRPRSGLINMDRPNHVMVELREMFSDENSSVVH
jgi:hypothetical protein